MTRYAQFFTALAAPFKGHEIKTRPQGGRQLQYITARTVMNRLDEVAGPESWWDEYQPLEHSVICRLTIRLPDGTALTKSDAGGYAGMSDSGDDDKSGFSDAFKRAAVKFGIGRHLYGDGVATLKAAVESGMATNGRMSPDPDVTQQYSAWAKAYCEDINRKWLADLAKSPSKNTKAPAEIVNRFKLAGHLIKWGRVAMNLKAPETVPTDEREKYTAELWKRDQVAVITEAREYCLDQWRKAKTPKASSDVAELQAQDDVLDILTSEAGARG
jgi:hypothetical protein